MTLILNTTAHPTLYQHPGPNGEAVHPGLGRLIQPRHTSSIEQTADAGIAWAADNDCFQGLDPVAYTRMLDRIAGLAGCIFVTVPDVVGDSVETARLFDEWLPELRARELPAALVAQDGLEIDDVPWSEIAALFIGGTDEFKLGDDAAVLAREAKRRGKWVHWGRVNSRKRFDLIRATGAADSFDGTQWSRFRKTYLDKGLSWTLEPMPELAESIRYTLPPMPAAKPVIGTVKLAAGVLGNAARTVAWRVEHPVVDLDDDAGVEPAIA